MKREVPYDAGLSSIIDDVFDLFVDFLTFTYAQSAYGEHFNSCSSIGFIPVSHHHLPNAPLVVKHTATSMPTNETVTNSSPLLYYAPPGAWNSADPSDPLLVSRLFTSLIAVGCSAGHVVQLWHGRLPVNQLDRWKG